MRYHVVWHICRGFSEVYVASINRANNIFPRNVGAHPPIYMAPHSSNPHIQHWKPAKKMFKMCKLHCTHPCTLKIFQSFAHSCLLKHSAHSPGFRNTDSAAYKPAATQYPGEYKQHMVLPCSHPFKY